MTAEPPKALSSTRAVLAAAGIPPSRLGSARVARLSSTERRLYRWILRRFATRGRPSRAATHAYARRLGLEGEPVLERLASEDLVHAGEDGEISVAYPFSGRPTAHRIRFGGGHEVYAMCAIDALGIAAMVDESIEIFSLDPLSGDAIGIDASPNLDFASAPDSAVVVAGTLMDGADSCSACCPVLNFFASRGNAERWLAERPDVNGKTISLHDAILAGDAVFGSVLRDD